MDAKTTAEQTADIIQNLTAYADRIVIAREEASKLKGGIAKNVQLNYQAKAR